MQVTLVLPTAWQKFLQYFEGHLKIFIYLFMPRFLAKPLISGVPRNFVSGGGSTNSVEDRGQRERGSGGGSSLVGGSGGSCNLLQEISFHIVKFY